MAISFVEENTLKYTQNDFCQTHLWQWCGPAALTHQKPWVTAQCRCRQRQQSCWPDSLGHDCRFQSLLCHSPDGGDLHPLCLWVCNRDTSLLHRLVGTAEWAKAHVENSARLQKVTHGSKDDDSSQRSSLRAGTVCKMLYEFRALLIRATDL